MKYKTRHSPISKNEIDACIKLLHKDYHEGYDLHIHYRKRDLIKWYLLNRCSIGGLKHATKIIFKEKSFGVFNRYFNAIHIYIFNYSNPYSSSKPEIISTLFHELRHYYQWNYKKNKYEKSFLNLEGITYESQLIERDANNFAARMMNKHCKEISEIINVYPDWFSPYNSNHK